MRSWGTEAVRLRRGVSRKKASDKRAQRLMTDTKEEFDMMRLLLPALLVLCLNGCATLTANDDLSVSDLRALEMTVSNALAPRKLENGKTYCAEDAATERAQDTCLGWLEDGFFLSEEDKARGLRLLQQGISEIEKARNPCGAWKRFTQPSRC